MKNRRPMWDGGIEIKDDRTPSRPFGLTFRKRFFISIAVFTVGIVGPGIPGSRQNDKEAARLGFASARDHLDAKKEDISDPVEWAVLIAQRGNE